MCGRFIQVSVRQGVNGRYNPISKRVSGDESKFQKAQLSKKRNSNTRSPSEMTKDGLLKKEESACLQERSKSESLSETDY